MTYYVYYNLCSREKYVKSDEAASVSDLTSSFEILDMLLDQKDDLNVYQEEIGYKAEVCIVEEYYYFRLFLKDGFYEIKTIKEKVYQLLKK